MNIEIALLCYFLLGAFAGTLSGLLGIGGGVIVVPGLAYLFMLEKVAPPHLMHLAEGTSLGVMIFTTSRSLVAHLKYKIEFWPIYRKMAPGVIIGALGGAILAHFLHSHVLGIIFATVLILIAIKMLLPIDPDKAFWRLPGRKGLMAVGSVIGLKSGLLGIGGGAVTVPFLTLCHVSLRTAVVVSVSVGFTVALIGSVSFLISGLGAPHLPQWSTGYIYWTALWPTAVGSVAFAPLGAKLSHELPVKILKRVFALLILLVGISMLVTL